MYLEGEIVCWIREINEVVEDIYCERRRVREKERQRDR